MTALMPEISALLMLQIWSVGFALFGTWLIRKPGRWMPFGFLAWLVSNPTAMVVMALQGNWPFFVMHLVFFWWAIESVWNWLVLPRLNQKEERLRVDQIE